MALCALLWGCQCCLGEFSGHNSLLCAQCSLLLSLQLLPGTSPRESEFDFCQNWDRFYVGTQCWSVWLLSLLRIPMQVLMGNCKRTCWGFLLCQPNSLCRTGLPGYFWGLTPWDVGNHVGIQMVCISACPAVILCQVETKELGKKIPDKAWTELSVVTPGLGVLRNLG